MSYRDHKSDSSQSGAKDVRKTPGKSPKAPPMGAKRKIIARGRNESVKKGPRG